MACSLIANTVLFAMTVKEICSMDAELKELGMDTRDNEMDRWIIVETLWFSTAFLHQRKTVQENFHSPSVISTI